MEEEEPMRLNLACIYHYVKLAYFSYAYTAPGMFFADLSHMYNLFYAVVASLLCSQCSFLKTKEAFQLSNCQKI